MKTFKKIIAFSLAMAMVAAVSVGATVAYLTSEDSDVNVMTLGNVKIEQHEYERVVDENGKYTTKTIDGVTSYELTDFTQAKPLYPIVGDPNEPGNSPAYAGWDDTIVRMTQVDSYGSMQVFAGKNAQDKFVTVENTGKSDAYVRTLVAIEVGTADSKLIGLGHRCVKEADKDDNTKTAPWVCYEIGEITVDNNTYLLKEYVYRGASDVNRHVNGVLPAGDTTYPNLSQVYLKHNATNEDMEAIDGNKNGTLDILVLSQAVQTNGFEDAQTALDTAFGKTAEKAAEWFGGVKMTVDAENAEDVNEALASGYDVVVDLSKAGEDGISGNYFRIYNNTEFMNGKITAGSAADYAVSGTDGSETTFNDVNIVSNGGGLGVRNGAKVVFNSGSVYVDTASTSGRYIFYATGTGTEIEINDGTFSWDPNDNDKRAYIYADAGTTVTVNGGTFGKASKRSGYTAGILGDGKVIIKGGTFGFNPTTWVADGYVANYDATAKTWTVSKIAE